MARRARLITLPLSEILVKEELLPQRVTVREGYSESLGVMVTVADDIGELARSIREIGLVSPPVVRLVGKRYVLLAGRRRLAALRQLGERGVTVVAWEDEIDDESAIRMAVDDNVCHIPLDGDAERIMVVEADEPGPSMSYAALARKYDVVHDNPTPLRSNVRTKAWDVEVDGIELMSGMIVRMPQPGWLSIKDIYRVTGKSYGNQGPLNSVLSLASSKKIMIRGKRGLSCVSLDGVGDLLGWIERTHPEGTARFRRELEMYVAQWGVQDR